MPHKKSDFLGAFLTKTTYLEFFLGLTWLTWRFFLVLFCLTKRWIFILLSFRKDTGSNQCQTPDNLAEMTVISESTVWTRQQCHQSLPCRPLTLFCHLMTLSITHNTTTEYSQETAALKHSQWRWSYDADGFYDYEKMSRSLLLVWELSQTH